MFRGKLLYFLRRDQEVISSSSVIKVQVSADENIYRKPGTEEHELLNRTLLKLGVFFPSCAI